MSNSKDALKKMNIVNTEYSINEDEIYNGNFEPVQNTEVVLKENYREGEYPPPEDDLKLTPAEVGIIDSVSQDDDDLYAKLEDGEIIPFKGHAEIISIDFYEWNSVKESSLMGRQVIGKAGCRIFINNRLARVLEGESVQELLTKADKAIDAALAQKHSIFREGKALQHQLIWYDNQPAIIFNVDIGNNLLTIIPDTGFIQRFLPPPSVFEEGITEEWVQKNSLSMNVHDYDEKIIWDRTVEATMSHIRNKSFSEGIPSVYTPTEIITTPNVWEPTTTWTWTTTTDSTSGYNTNIPFHSMKMHNPFNRKETTAKYLDPDNTKSPKLKEISNPINQNDLINAIASLNPTEKIKYTHDTKGPIDNNKSLDDLDENLYPNEEGVEEFQVYPS